MPPTIGSVANPDSVGVSPTTICRYSGIVIIAPNIAKPTRKPSTVAMEKVPERNSFSGMIASGPIFASISTKAAMPTAPIT